jgi:hypothetical protein
MTTPLTLLMLLKPLKDSSKGPRSIMKSLGPQDSLRLAEVMKLRKAVVLEIVQLLKLSHLLVDIIIGQVIVLGVGEADRLILVGGGTGIEKKGITRKEIDTNLKQKVKFLILLVTEISKIVKLPYHPVYLLHNKRIRN